MTLTASALVLGAGTGWSYWTATVFGQGAATTGTVIAPSGVTATVTVDPGTVSVSWTAAVTSAGAAVQGYFVTRIDDSDATTSAACATTPATATTELTCQDQPQPDGHYRYVVTAVHHSWTGRSTPSDSVHVDTTAPDPPSAPDLTAASDSGASASDGITSDSTPTFTGTAEPGARVTLYVAGVPVGDAVAVGGQYSITAAALPDGAHVVTASATDTAGNTGVEHSGTQITVDTLRPTVTVDQDAEQSDPTNQQPITFTAAFSEPVTGLTAADVGLSAPAGATVALSGTGPTYQISVTGMTADGTVTVRLDADVVADLAGNGSDPSTSSDATVSYDGTAPAAPSAPTLTAASDSGSSSSDRVTRVTSPTFTGSAEVGSTVTLYSGTVPVGTAVAVGGGYTITTSPLAQGAQIVTATATDAAGNTSPASTGTTVTIDSIAPSVTIGNVSYSNGYVTSAGTGGTGLGDAGTVSLVICTVSTFPCPAGDTLDSATPTVDPATGAWTDTSRDLKTCNLILICEGPGQIYLRATQTDLAGNIGSSGIVTRNYP